jgi:hypothetical protein
MSESEMRERDVHHFTVYTEFRVHSSQNNGKPTTALDERERCGSALFWLGIRTDR